MLKKKKVYVIALLIVFIIALLGFNFVRLTKQTKIKYSFDGSAFCQNYQGENLASDTIRVMEDGNKPQLMNQRGFDLPKGVYEVEVNYERGKEAYITIGANKKWSNSLYADRIQLKSSLYTKTYEIWANDELNDVHFCLEGDEGFRITSITITTAWNSALHEEVKLIAGVIFLLLIVLGIWNRKKIVPYAPEIIFLGASALIASLGFLVNYLPYGHDYAFHVLRIEGIKDGLIAGQFPVRIQPNWNNGWGYAVAILYGNLTLYVPALLRLCGFTMNVALKAYVLGSNVLTAIAAYYAFKVVSKNREAAIFGAVFYTTFCYRIIDVMIRAAYGEYSAMMFLPLAALAVYYALTQEVDTHNFRKTCIAPIIGLSGLLQSHALTCIMFSIAAVLVFAVFWKRTFRLSTLLYLLKLGGMAIMVNLWFLIPFLRYMKEPLAGVSVKEMPYDFQQLGPTVAELFSNEASPHAWWSFSEVTSINNKFSRAFGNGILLAVLLIVFLLCTGNKIQKKRKETIALICLGGLFLLMSTDIFPYYALANIAPKIMSLVAKVNIPYRYMSIAALLLCFGIVLGLSGMKKNLKFDSKVGMIILIFAIFGIQQTLSVTYGTLYDGVFSADYSGGKYDTTNVIGGEYLYEGCSTYVTEVDSDPIGINSNPTQMVRNKQWISVTIDGAGQDAFVDLPRFWYPGYKAYDANMVFPVTKSDNNGRIRVELPEGYKGVLTVRFVEPVLWRIAEIISVLSIVFMGIYAVGERKAFTNDFFKKQR